MQGPMIFVSVLVHVSMISRSMYFTAWTYDMYLCILVHGPMISPYIFQFSAWTYDICVYISIQCMDL